MGDGGGLAAHSIHNHITLCGWEGVSQKVAELVGHPINQKVMRLVNRLINDFTFRGWTMVLVMVSQKVIKESPI